MSQPEAPVGLRRPGRFLAPLESLRGWAILLVVAFHYLGILVDGSADGLPADAGWWLHIAAAGNTGVTLFFVLSGFLLSQPFIEAARWGERVSIMRFYVARLLRILPLYYAAVLVAWLVSGNLHSAVKAMFFIPVGFQIFPFSVPWWSLATEMQFYLLLPWAMLMLRFHWGRWLCVALLLAWWVAHCIYFFQPHALGPLNMPWVQSSVFGRGAAFLIGALCCWFYLSGGLELLAKRQWLVSCVVSTLLLCLLLLLQWYGETGQKPALEVMPLYHDLEALLWGGLLLCALTSTGLLGRLGLNPLFAHFGTISFSLYLIHVPVQFYLIYPAKVASEGVMAAVVASFLLSWALSIVCYRVIERPFLQLKAHLPVLTERYRARPAKA